MDMAWAKLYANLIRNKDFTGKTIEDVPENLRPLVEKLLKQ